MIKDKVLTVMEEVDEFFVYCGFKYVSQNIKFLIIQA